MPRCGHVKVVKVKNLDKNKDILGCGSTCEMSVVKLHFNGRVAEVVLVSRIVGGLSVKSNKLGVDQ